MEMRSSTRSTVFLAVFAAAVLTGATVMAAPITLPVSPLFIQYSSNEQFSLSNSIQTTGPAGPTTEGNWGILQISSIEKGTAPNPRGSDIQGGGANVFFNGQAGGNQITGIFYGVQNTGVNPGGFSSTGGFIDLYWQDVGTANTGADLAAGFNPARRPNQKTYTGYAEPGNPAFIFLAQLAFGPGCDGVATHHICTGVVPATTDGVAKSYQSVNLAAGGVWASQLDSNFFTLDANGNPLVLAQDVRTESNFNRNSAAAWNGLGIVADASCPNGHTGTGQAPCDIIGLRADGPVKLEAVPEPGTLSLFGLGLLGAGFLRRRKQRRNQT
jgi:hypothetical protein